MIELAIKELIEMHASYCEAPGGSDFDDGYLNGLEAAIVVLEDFIAAGKEHQTLGPSKERLLALADKLLVLGSPKSSKELLDMAERFGV